MRCLVRFLGPILALAGLLAAPAGAGPPPERTIVIGTAPVAGIYFPAGGALCNLVNRQRERHGLRCLVESTAGSADNLERLRRGELDFALVQSDWQYLAVHDEQAGNAQPAAELRAVFSLHGQPITVVTGRDSGIAALDDLKGRRISLGPADSALRAVGEALIGALGWREGDFEQIAALEVGEQIGALCGGRIDAFILPVSHPSSLVAAATESCGAVLVAVDGAAVDRLTEEWPFYAAAEIPAGLYRNNPEPVPSYGLRATLVTTSAQPEDVVYELVAAVLGDLDALAAQHAALAGLNLEEMVAVANTAPFHEGALRYYREHGLQ